MQGGVILLPWSLPRATSLHSPVFERRSAPDRVPACLSPVPASAVFVNIRRSVRFRCLSQCLLCFSLFFPPPSYLFFPFLCFFIKESGAVRQAVVLCNVAMNLQAERQLKDISTSCLTVRLNHILEELVRLHTLLITQQTLSHSPAWITFSFFACVMIVRDKTPVMTASSHLEQFAPCTAEGMGSHPSGAAQQQRQEVFQPKGNRPKGALKMKV